MKIINEASEKFKDKQNEICDFLFDFLRKLNALEKEIYDRGKELERKKEELGIPKSQIAPGKRELYDEFEERLDELTEDYVTDKLFERGYSNSFGNPQKYGYIDGECRVKFIMKTANKAVVETHYSQGIDEKHKFVIKNVDGEWLIDEVYYGFEDEPGEWSISEII